MVALAARWGVPISSHQSPIFGVTARKSELRRRRRASATSALINVIASYFYQTSLEPTCVRACVPAANTNQGQDGVHESCCQ